MSLHCAQQLQNMVNQLSPKARVAALKQARRELDEAIDQLENCQGEAMRHFGD
ncbi:MAG: prefoldin subunit 5 [Saprospiraceae bacterium]|jgi:prefoldin subunit 5